MLLLASVFLIAACGLVYELAAGALASYLLGDSVLQFSTVIGVYLFAMGVGSWLSRYVERQLVGVFLQVELLVGVVGGLMPAALFAVHSLLPPGEATAFRVLLYALVLLVGTLVGLEIPLVMRILKRNVALRDLVSQVLTFDYLGALAVSVAFPLVLVPQLGLIRTGLLFGLMNALVALWALWLFRHELRRFAAHALACVLTIGALGGAFAGSRQITSMAEDRFYQDKIVLAESSQWQRIVLTQGRSGLRLFLNGNLQFAQADEYRYHEALVHPAMAAHGAARKVAVLGGGDGIAVREILRYPGVESVTLVELDPKMTQLFATDARLVEINGGALHSPKVRVVNTDAFQWLQQTGEMFDVIVVDFPDPTNFSIGKLYTNAFYALLEQRLAASGYAVVQTTSPLVARQSFWMVVSTIESVGLRTAPYHAHVPSFGEWGFVIAGRRPWRAPESLPDGLRFLTAQGVPPLFDFPRDMARVPADVNRLANQALVTTYEREWGKVQP
ncbi:MAG: polyamine aminopropyltransferase [Comamonadaceae bacterium]|nr:MAG: polyamine aminopropyltransferase [Comamonadaceae bacterium]